MGRPKGFKVTDEEKLAKSKKMKDWYANLSEEEKKAIVEARTTGMRASEKYKNKMTLKVREQIANTLVNRWSSLSDEEKTEHARKTSEGTIIGWQNIDPEVKAQRDKKIAEALSRIKTGKVVGPYKGDTYTEGTIRSSSTNTWDEFKEKVIERDSNRCQFSGCQTTQSSLDSTPGLVGPQKSLHVNHRLPWEEFRDLYKEFPELYYELDGVILFCQKHHLQEDWRLRRLSRVEIIKEFELVTGKFLPVG